jgi:hypothetical protein
MEYNHDVAYNLYDKPLFMASGSSIYKPKNLDSELHGAAGNVDLNAIMEKNRFVPDKGFSGADTVEVLLTCIPITFLT